MVGQARGRDDLPRQLRRTARRHPRLALDHVHGDADGRRQHPGTSAASVVVVGDTFEPNDTFTTPAAARALGPAPSTSYIGSPATSTTSPTPCRPAPPRDAHHLPAQPPAGGLRPRRLRPERPAAQRRRRRRSTASRSATRRRRSPTSTTRWRRRRSTTSRSRDACRRRDRDGHLDQPRPRRRRRHGRLPGQRETYTIQVSGFNGASSDSPYMLASDDEAAARR